MTNLFNAEKIGGNRTLIYQELEFQMEAGAFYFFVQLVETDLLARKPHRVLSPMVTPYRVLE
jgi:hypothetical protein